MRKRKLYRRTISALLIVVLLTATTGFRIESHSCDHCGLDVSLSFFTYPESGNKGCCGTVDTSSQSSTNCDINAGTCCTLTDSSYELEEPYIVTSGTSDLETAPLLWALSRAVAESDFLAPKTYTDILPRYGGRQLITLNSQYRT